MKFTKIATLLFFTLFIFNCNKSRFETGEVLPNAHNSLNQRVFGCLVNGEVWTPKSRGIGILSPIEFSYSTSPREDFFIAAEKFKKDEPIGNIVFHSQFKEAGKHKIYAAFYEGFGCDYEAIHIDTNNPSNFVEIDSLERKGAANHIVIIGRFQFTAIDTICQDTVRITEGRFKVTTS